MDMKTLMKINAEVLSSIPCTTENVKEFHRSFPTGVTIVTAKGNVGEPVGLAVNAFSSVSMNPPIALVCVNQSSRSHESLHAGTHVGVSILAHDQVNVAKTFATSGGNKFEAVPWQSAADGSPFIEGASASLEMEVVERIAAGTHTVFVGIITQAITSGKPPLVYLDGKFFDGAELTSV